MGLKTARMFFLLMGALRLALQWLHIAESSRRKWMLSFLGSILIGLCENYLNLPHLAMAMIVICGYECVHRKESFKLALIAAVISVALINILFSVSLTILFPLAHIIAAKEIINATLVDLLSVLAAGGIVQLLAAFLCSVKRLKNGMTFLARSKYLDVGFWVSVVLLGWSMVVSEENVDQYLRYVLLSGAVILLWWLGEMNSFYREQSQERRADRMEAETVRLREEIDRLKRENYELSRTNHAANKLIPSLRWLTENMMEAATFHDMETERYARESVAYIDTAVNERFGYPAARMALPRTGVPAADSMIAAMAERMAAEGVDFRFVSMGSVRLLTDAEVPPEELAALLGDLLTNRMRAVEDSAEKRVFLHIGVAEDVCELSVYDSGAAFPPEVIRKLGLERVTSRPTSGGSGIGLEAVFDILRAHRASFCLDEDVTPPYTKRVAVRFDGKGRTVIRSGREEVLALREERPDVLLENMNTVAEEAAYI